MFLTPYDTTICKSHRMERIRADLQETLVGGDFYPYRPGIGFITDQDTQIAPFAHPIVIKHSSTDEDMVMVDVRSVARLDRSNETLRGGVDFEFVKVRAGLQRAWLIGSPQDLLTLGDLGMSTFARLMADNLGKRMGLDLNTMLRLQVIAAYYYLGLFTDELGRDEREHLKYAQRIARSTGRPVQNVLEILDAVEPMYSLAEFVEQIQQHGNSVRLDKLSPAVIYTMLGGIWFGTNPTETVAVALEHPPTFLAMVYMIISDRSYRKTVLGQLIRNQVDRRGELSEPFEKNVRRLIQD